MRKRYSMEVEICVERGTDISAVEREYSDIEEDGDDGTRFFIGQSSDERREKGEREWMDYDEAVACCGFVEGAIPGASVLIEGNGGWAQSMISRTDFSGLAISDKERCSYEKTSDLFWKHFRRGKRLRKARKTKTKPAKEIKS